MSRRFRQIDVFSATPYLGNPVAVVLDGDGLSDEQMQRIARWTNLSETTFLMEPSDPAADYRVRIWMPTGELPFAGHPTLGSCHAWLADGGAPRQGADVVVQECGAGLVELRRRGRRWAFAAPPLVRSGPAEPEIVDQVADELRIDRDAILDCAWVDNGPGWVAALLGSPEEVLAVEPGPLTLDIGVVALHPAGSEAAIEVRGFFPKDGAATEDPVTGSLNAGLADWLIAGGRLAAPYVAAQGTALGRAGRVHIDQDADGQIWVGGATVTCVTGEIEA